MFIYTRHAISKLKIRDNRILKIHKKQIENTIRHGQIIEHLEGIKTVVGRLDDSHSLCVVYRQEKGNVVIITFFAARKGRYERKILH